MHQRELARAGVPFVPGFVITSESSTALPKRGSAQLAGDLE